MKRKLLILVILILACGLTACHKEKDSIVFKNNYESLNGTENANGKEHRTVEIDENNSFIISNINEVIEKIKNEDSFYVYFGSALCPWCRSTIEKAIEISNDNEIEKIYYVDMWDEDGNELYRDKYTKDDDGNSVLEIEGKEEYFELLELLSDVLPDYEIKNNDGTISTEKRIYLPSYIYIAKGKPVRITDGISSLQEDSREELTSEILEEETTLFENFFVNSCDETC